MKLYSKPYMKYLKSNNEWFEYIPSEWSEKRVKDLFRLVTDMAPENNNYELLSLYTNIGVRPRKELEARGNKAISTDGYWIVKKGDIIVNKLLAWMGAIGLSEYEGVTSPAYDILRKISPIIDERFFAYLFKTEKAQQIFKRYSRGIMDVRLRLYFDKFGAITVPVPSFPTQKSIANYLDTKTSQIDYEVALLAKKAAKYNELKQSLINESVTRGLDKTVEMKDSGVELIGRIPEHWKVKRLKDIISALESGSREKGGASDKGVFSLSAEHIDWDGHFNFTNEKFVGKEYYEKMTSGKLKVGDILLTKDGATIGKCAYLSKLYFNKMAVNEHMFILRGNKVTDNKFLYYLITSLNGRLQIRKTMKTTAIPGISSNFVMDVFFCIPNMQEQQAIASYLDTKTTNIDYIVEMINNEIQKLKELRNTLINDVVTGKIKVTRKGE